MPDIGADTMYANATEKGTIDTIPEIPGLAVWHEGHIGIYIGGGKVIEAMGTKYGVVETELAGRGWTHWLKVPYITYLDTEMSSSANEKHIWDTLYAKIGNPYGVAGLMGNLYAESALRPDNLQGSFEDALGHSDASYCYIAEEKDNDMYRSIYCHLDGYPEEVGKLLVKYYDTTEKLRELLALGDVYCLQKKLNPDPSALHCFGNYQKDVTVAFGRDREENGFEAKDRTLDEMLDSSEDPEFVYIFTAEQEWEFCHLYDYDVSFRKVRDVLSKESPGEEDAEPEKGQKDAPNLHI